MYKHVLLAALASILFSSSSGCVMWRHCWGSWAYYGTTDSCGYCDNCPPGPCAKHPGPFCGLFSGCGGEPCCDSCGDCCDNGCGDCCSCGSCGPSHGLFHGIFQSPGPVGCTDIPCQGCGEKYWCDWINYPPTCDPCDCCGNFTGPRDPRPSYQQSPRSGSIPLHANQSGAELYQDDPGMEPTPAEPDTLNAPYGNSRRDSMGVQRAAYRGQRPRGIFSR